jgi:hypothetical protein
MTWSRAQLLWPPRAPWAEASIGGCGRETHGGGAKAEDPGGGATSPRAMVNCPGPVSSARDGRRMQRAVGHRKPRCFNQGSEIFKTSWPRVLNIWQNICRIRTWSKLQREFVSEALLVSYVRSLKCSGFTCNFRPFYFKTEKVYYWNITELFLEYIKVTWRYLTFF